MWDVISLRISNGCFEAYSNDVRTMSSRWAESFQPTVEQFENYHDREMNGETLTAEEQFISDLKSTAGSATVEDVKPDIETGRRIGEARAKAAETYNQVMDAYRK